MRYVHHVWLNHQLEWHRVFFLSDCWTWECGAVSVNDVDGKIHLDLVPGRRIQWVARSLASEWQSCERTQTFKARPSFD